MYQRPGTSVEPSRISMRTFAPKRTSVWSQLLRIHVEPDSTRMSDPLAM